MGKQTFPDMWEEEQVVLRGEAPSQVQKVLSALESMASRPWLGRFRSK